MRPIRIGKASQVFIKQKNCANQLPVGDRKLFTCGQNPVEEVLGSNFVYRSGLIIKRWNKYRKRSVNK